MATTSTAASRLFRPRRAPTSVAAPAAAPAVLLKLEGIEVSTAALSVGAKSVPLAGATSYRIDIKFEEGHRLGNIIMSNLYVGATLIFLIGVLSEVLSTRFWLAVILFGMLSGTCIDDLLRSKGLKLYRLLVRRPDGETLAFVTSDAAVMEKVALAMDSVLPRTA